MRRGEAELCVDNVNTKRYLFSMAKASQSADVNIHLRARPRDRKLIDRAAELSGANRSQFMLAAALKEAKNVLVDQTTIYADAKSFQKILDWMDKPASAQETAGMKRLLAAKATWKRE
jgi:uncharacterized protein (DUF1778 family)